MPKGVRGRRGVAKAGKETQVKLKTGTETVRFDKAKSEANRKASAASAQRYADRKAAGQRVSGRASSRATTLKKVHGRTDAQKIKSKALAKRNVRYGAEAVATALPGGAAAGYAAKAQKVGKAGKYLASAGRRAAAQAGKKGVASAVKAGTKRVVKDTAKKVARQGVRKTAATAGRAAAATGKYLAETKGQTAVNQAITRAATGRA